MRIRIQETIRMQIRNSDYNRFWCTKNHVEVTNMTSLLFCVKKPSRFQPCCRKLTPPSSGAAVGQSPWVPELTTITGDAVIHLISLMSSPFSLLPFYHLHPFPFPVHPYTSIFIPFSSLSVQFLWSSLFCFFPFHPLPVPTLSLPFPSFFLPFLPLFIPSLFTPFPSPPTPFPFPRHPILPRLPTACLPVVILVPATYHVSYLINFSRIVLALFYGWVSHFSPFLSPILSPSHQIRTVSCYLALYCGAILYVTGTVRTGTCHWHTLQHPFPRPAAHTALEKFHTAIWRVLFSEDEFVVKESEDSDTTEMSDADLEVRPSQHQNSSFLRDIWILKSPSFISARYMDSQEPVFYSYFPWPWGWKASVEKFFRIRIN